jgi:hypothetical protein
VLVGVNGECVGGGADGEGLVDEEVVEVTEELPFVRRVVGILRDVREM